MYKDDDDALTLYIKWIGGFLDGCLPLPFEFEVIFFVINYLILLCFGDYHSLGSPLFFFEPPNGVEPFSQDYKSCVIPIY